MKINCATGPSVRRTSRLASLCLLTVLLAACRDSNAGTPIIWHQGTPPPSVFGRPAEQPSVPETPAPGMAAANPTSWPNMTPIVTKTVESRVGDRLTAAERFQSRPNELGLIPILMYHMYHEIVPTGTTDDGYTRTVVEFRRDLGLLYELGYYVVPLRDIVADEIRAPLGKHPVALTFDDGTANHMRYLVGANGSISIDPESAIGVLEAFFAEYPDFGRGGYFAVPPETCFDWQKAGAEPDQTPYCAQKLRWLLDHGYEVGNHTVDHGDLLDLDDDAFMNEVGGGWLGLAELVPELEPDILAMPYGNYPDSEAHPGQRQMLREGFLYQGVRVSIAGALMVGAEPTVSPSSTGWDPLFIARIRAYDGELGSTEWLYRLAEEPSSLYTSDGDSATITLPVPLEDDLDRTRAERAGKQIVAYDPATGAAV